MEITITEALSQGYIFACDETCEFFKGISKLTDEDFEYHDLFLASKDTFGFSGISAGTLEEICVEAIEGQDEVQDEDGDLEEELTTVNWQSIADQINACFKKRYHSATDIRLLPNS